MSLIWLDIQSPSRLTCSYLISLWVHCLTCALFLCLQEQIVRQTLDDCLLINIGIWSAISATMKITFQQKALLARTVRHMFSAGSEDMNNLQLVKRSSTSSTDHKVPSAGCSVCLGDCDPDVSSAKLLDGRSSVASCSSQQRYGDQRNLHTCTSSTQHLSYR